MSGITSSAISVGFYSPVTKWTKGLSMVELSTQILKVYILFGYEIQVLKLIRLNLIQQSCFLESILGHLKIKFYRRSKDVKIYKDFTLKLEYRNEKLEGYLQ